MNWNNEHKSLGSHLSLVKFENQKIPIGYLDSPIKHIQKAKAQNAAEHALKDRRFNQLWEERYYLSLPSLRDLISFPKGTLGFKYAAHMLQNNLAQGLHLASMPRNPSAYLVALSQQSHDLWHTVTGYDASPLGETALEMFYVAQTNPQLSLTRAISQVLNQTYSVSIQTSSLKSSDSCELYETLQIAYERAKKTKFLLGVKWDAHLNEPLKHIQEELCL